MEKIKCASRFYNPTSKIRITKISGTVGMIIKISKYKKDKVGLHQEVEPEWDYNQV